MPAKEKIYDRVRFSPKVIQESVSILLGILPKKDRNLSVKHFTIINNNDEAWSFDTQEEFFAEYVRGFQDAHFEKRYTGGGIDFRVHPIRTSVTIVMQTRADVEKMFNFLEVNVEDCRLPKQPEKESKAETEWVAETINRIETHCPVAARKVRLALLKLDSEDAEEWQNATMLIRDAWIELSQWLCQVKNIDTSDIPPDSVIDRLKRVKLEKIDERLFNLARASFSLYSKHHKRDIDHDTAVACVISTVVSMKTVIREVLNAAG